MHALHNARRMMILFLRRQTIMELPLVAVLFLIMNRWCLELTYARPVFDVTDFGAVADGETDNSKVIAGA